MKILLTGSNGFIGGEIQKYFGKNITYLLNKFNDKLMLSNNLDRQYIFSPLDSIESWIPNDIDIVLNFGAIADTLSKNKKIFNEFNYTFTINLIKYCAKKNIFLIHASSASVYGNNKVMNENQKLDYPINLYAKSKLMIDQNITDLYSLNFPIISLRLFNIYGSTELKKGSMASIIWKFSNDILKNKYCSIFTIKEKLIGSQSRDFVYVQDLCRIIEYLIQHPKNYGIINFGTGISTQFRSIATQIFEFARVPKNIKYIEMPTDFFQHYQWYTASDRAKFNKYFPHFEFTSISHGIQSVLFDLKKVND